MYSLEPLKIDLKALTEQETLLDYTLDDNYFGALDGAQLEHGALHVSVSIRKMAGFFELLIHTQGTVTVSCDRCLDDMEWPIDTDDRLVVRLGETCTEDETGVTVSELQPELDLSWYIYEFVMLAIPIKHVHAPGKCNSAMTQRLSELSGAARSSEEETGAADPRWAKLKELTIES